MQHSLTQASKDEYDRIRSGEMTPAMAAAYLRDGRIPLRSFGGTLRELYPHPDLLPKLVAAFVEDGMPAASAQRRVTNWLEDANAPTDREDVFHIAFALSFSLEETSRLLGLVSGYGIHYRDGRDLVYAWCLRHGWDYRGAREFFDSLPPMPTVERMEKNEDPYTVTHRMQSLVLRADNEAQFRELYVANLHALGEMHLRAYRYFSRFMETLVQPTSAWDTIPEAAYSLETVMEKYLTLGMPSGKSRAGYTATQRLIKRNWPNTTALKNILNRRKDVPRKLLLLLYIITGNDGDEHWWIINAMLLDCGMAPLDPRNASDWLFCYALTAQDDESMGVRLEQVIDSLYANVKDD